MKFYKFPFNGDTPQQVKDKIVGQNVRFPKESPSTEEFLDLIRGLLIKDPT
jgi:hypothetical protein